MSGGRPPAARSAELRSLALALVEHDPGISGPELAAHLGCSSRTGRRLLREIHEPVATGADGRALRHVPVPTVRVTLPVALVGQVTALTGEDDLADAIRALCEELAELGPTPTARRRVRVL
jgi:hypothetical protein